MDKVEKVINALAAGEITAEQANAILVRQTQDEDKNWYNRHSSIEEEAVPYSESPLENIIKRELKEDRHKEIENIFSTLSDTEKRIVWLVIGEGRTVRATAGIMHMPKSTVFDTLTKAWIKISDKITDFSHYLCRDDIFYKRVNIDFMPPVKTIGWPFEIARQVNVGGKWKNHSGKKVFVSQAKCFVRKYLSQAFGDTETVCPLCSKCRGEAIT